MLSSAVLDVLREAIFVCDFSRFRLTVICSKIGVTPNIFFDIKTDIPFLLWPIRVIHPDPPRSVYIHFDSIRKETMPAYIGINTKGVLLMAYIT